MKKISRVFLVLALLALFANQGAATEENKTDGTTIQTVLQKMGYYSESIDGNINTFASRKAIKSMHEDIGDGKSPFLTPQSVATLMELAPLYSIESELTNESKTTRATNIKIQTSLRVLGFSSSVSDGIMGSRTWDRVARYKKANDLDEKSRLTTVERKELIAKARSKNSEAIKSLKKQLKVL